MMLNGMRSRETKFLWAGRKVHCMLLLGNSPCQLLLNEGQEHQQKPMGLWGGGFSPRIPTFVFFFAITDIESLGQYLMGSGSVCGNNLANCLQIYFMKFCLWPSINYRICVQNVNSKGKNTFLYMMFHLHQYVTTHLFFPIWIFHSSPFSLWLHVSCRVDLL